MSITLLKDSMTKSLEKIRKELASTPQELYDYWVSITPIRSGNARRRTKLENNKTIAAKYPYAVPLDEGLSKQAPDGMSKPTEKYLKRLLDKKIRK
jgi:hypothetical protein